MRVPFLSALASLHLETQDMFVAVWFEFSSRRRPVEGFSHEVVYSVLKRRSRGIRTEDVVSQQPARIHEKCLFSIKPRSSLRPVREVAIV
jgi:hypothetical protein